MRYSVYKFLRGISASILEGVTYVKEKPTSINILADCAEGLVSIKESLTLNKENNLEEIDLALEKINEIADCIENNKKYSDKLDELLDLAQKVDEYCKTQIKYKFRILFIAELGAKWDSMDSVYWACKNREDCDVEVVIAPIYRAVKCPNGEVKSDVIYKDYLTPMGIKHTLFNEYDITKALPDITFTSQPYESVMPEQFWAENIIPYTHLVYLPYFTAAGLYDIPTQTQMPTHELAWKVICQSEEVKDAYSRYCYTKGSNMIGCGLPKWDWVINSNKRDIELPKEWKKLNGKRIMLYCTHYSSMKLFDTASTVYISYLEKFGKGTGIIFRFHPMSETIIKVYFPQYLELWNDFVEKIDKSENAVIDRFENYDYAFKFSDFLCTQPSSMIYQYYLTQKPILIRYPYKGEGVEFIKDEDIGEIAYKENLEFLIQSMFDGNIKEKQLKNGMINLDGKIGERLVSQLLEELKEEI